MNLHLRLMLAGARLVRCPEVVARARVHSSVHRIDNLPWYLNDPTLHLDIIEYHRELIAGTDPSLLSTAVREALSTKLWARGMIAGRNGAFKVARLYFKQAKQDCPSFDPPVQGLFRTAYKMFGPNIAVILLHLKDQLRRLGG
jgi:hypothetical protein